MLQRTVECFGFVGLRLATLLGVQTAEECMLKHIVQRGTLGTMAEESVVSSSSSVTSDGELSEEDLAKYSSLVRPYQDKP